MRLQTAVSTNEGAPQHQNPYTIFETAVHAILHKLDEKAVERTGVKVNVGFHALAVWLDMRMFKRDGRLMLEWLRPICSPLLEAASVRIPSKTAFVSTNNKRATLTMRLLENPPGLQSAQMSTPSIRYNEMHGGLGSDGGCWTASNLGRVHISADDFELKLLSGRWTRVSRTMSGGQIWKGVMLTGELLLTFQSLDDSDASETEPVGGS
ncbi:hypothetical protein C8R44DRAFT_925090 [Mycena epipterygia]|nr:hypothetical protein C8R44DRAFT_925090 [Mycena epipterygia]